jgi:hypothetical protein
MVCAQKKIAFDVFARFDRKLIALGAVIWPNTQVLFAKRNVDVLIAQIVAVNTSKILTLFKGEVKGIKRKFISFPIPF